MRCMILLFTTFLLIANREKTTQPTKRYDSLLFERKGGGNLVFVVYPTETRNTFRVVVSALSYRDTTISMILSKDSANATTFDALTRTLNGQNKIAGDFKQATKPTGTWAYLYMVKGSNRTEITNTKLRKVLLDLERVVRAKL
jgi:hypothetical protein